MQVTLLQYLFIDEMNDFAIIRLETVNHYFFEMQSDLPLGILKNHDYQEYTYRFVSGSGILLYTDGVTDAENEKNEFYTRERLLEIVTQNQELHPREFIRSIINDIQSHIKSHELSDDLSMLTFIYGSEWNIKKS